MIVFCPAIVSQTAAELNERGLEVLRSGDAAAALAILEEAAGKAPGDPAVSYSLGLALFQLGRYSEALQPLEHSLGNADLEKPARYLRGVILFQQQNYSRCADELEHVREDARYAERVLYMLTESYRNAGRAEEAQQAFVELHQQHPNSAFLHKLMGMAYEAQDYDEKALAEFHAALRAEPGMPDIAFGIGYIHFKAQDYEQARKWMERELEVQPCHGNTHFYLGEMHRFTGDWPAAESRYRKALQCNPELVDARIGLGTVYERQEELEQAIEQYRAGVESSPDNSAVRFKLGNALRRAGRAEEARQELSRAKELYNEEMRRQAGERERRRSP